MNSEDLAEAIRDTTEDRGYSNRWCQQLLIMMHIWEESFTPKRASEEVMYQAAHSFATLLEEAHEALEKAEQERQNIELDYANL